MFEKLKAKLASKDENSPAFRRMMAQKINGREIRYVTERRGNDETVIGHSGSIQVYHDKIHINADGKTVFSGTVGEVTVSELMSLDGVILTGKDHENGDMERAVVAYYLYYRKEN